MLPRGDGESWYDGICREVEEPEATFGGIKAKFGDDGHIARDSKRGANGSEEKTGEKSLKKFTAIIAVRLFYERWNGGWIRGVWIKRRRRNAREFVLAVMDRG
jgi:hypothetical protein